MLLPDPDGELDLTPARVAALCDRRRGLGADGVLRVVRWAALGDGPAPEPGVEWFMDYRNADGSVAEMCGNGVRVYARYLEDAGWLPRPGVPAGHARRGAHRPRGRRGDLGRHGPGHGRRGEHGQRGRAGLHRRRGRRRQPPPGVRHRRSRRRWTSPARPATIPPCSRTG